MFTPSVRSLQLVRFFWIAILKSTLRKSEACNPWCRVNPGRAALLRADKFANFATTNTVALVIFSKDVFLYRNHTEWCPIRTALGRRRLAVYHCSSWANCKIPLYGQILVLAMHTCCQRLLWLATSLTLCHYLSFIILGQRSSYPQISLYNLCKSMQSMQRRRNSWWGHAQFQRNTISWSAPLLSISKISYNSQAMQTDAKASWMCITRIHDGSEVMLSSCIRPPWYSARTDELNELDYNILQ